MDTIRGQPFQVVTATDCVEEHLPHMACRIDTLITTKVPLRLMMDMCIATVDGLVHLFLCRTEVITTSFQDKPLMTTDIFITTGE